MVYLKDGDVCLGGLSDIDQSANDPDKTIVEVEEDSGHRFWLDFEDVYFAN